MGFVSWIKSFVGLVKRAVVAAIENGVTEPLMKLAISYAKDATNRFVDNAQKREWVVNQLVTRGVPESLARVLTELAVQFIKKELAK